MARPFKRGLDYFPLDVDFLQDDKIKLIKSEFGAKGVMIWIVVLCQIYKTGYYKNWGQDECLLMSEELSSGGGDGVYPPNLIREVVLGFIRRGVFDKVCFDTFKILTSVAIQRTYLKAMIERQEISFIKEYLLLDMEDTQDVPLGVRGRIVIKSMGKRVNPPINSINPPINSINQPINAQSKGERNESKLYIPPSPPKNQSEGIPPNPQRGRKLMYELMSKFDFSRKIQECVCEWVEYKNYRYNEIGLFKLLKTISEKITAYGNENVFKILNESMASGYQGIAWNNLSSKKQKNIKTNFENSQYSQADIDSLFSDAKDLLNIDF